MQIEDKKNFLSIDKYGSIVFVTKSAGSPSKFTFNLLDINNISFGTLAPNMYGVSLQCNKCIIETEIENKKITNTDYVMFISTSKGLSEKFIEKLRKFKSII